MRRNIFMIIAAVLSAYLGLTTLIMPGQMPGNMISATRIKTQYILQWSSAMLLSIALINFLARNDMGSKSLQAIMIGNIFMNALAFVVDVYYYNFEFIRLSGLVSEGFVHILLISSFMYYLTEMKT